MLKVKKIREKSDEELLQFEHDLTEDFFKLRFQHATGQMENPTKLRQIRQDIARVKTVIRERQIGIDLSRKTVSEADKGNK
ncbi:MAG: 50S ribosomal protein L29 [Acidobacteria bacterium]|nr:50S ribosomal protein L29 [Acidobacteriota bacterium]